MVRWFRTLQRRIYSGMTTNDIPTRPKSQNPRLNRRNQSSGRCQADEIRIKRTMTAAHRSSSKLPNVLAKANIYSSAPGNQSYKTTKFKLTIFFFLGFCSWINDIQTILFINWQNQSTRNNKQFSNRFTNIIYIDKSWWSTTFVRLPTSTNLCFKSFDAWSWTSTISWILQKSSC